LKKSFLSLGFTGGSLWGIIWITAEVTLGGGEKAEGGTVKSFFAMPKYYAYAIISVWIIIK
jgi:hypothetical protein